MNDYVRRGRHLYGHPMMSVFGLYDLYLYGRHPYGRYVDQIVSRSDYHVKIENVYCLVAHGVPAGLVRELNQ